MVNFIDCGREEFICRTKGKNVYCFGAGKYLEDFSNENYDISVKGVIDNYRCADTSWAAVNGIMVKICSVDTFMELYDDACAVVITSSFFMEILKQLDSVEMLEGMDCYIELFIRYRAGDHRRNLEFHIAQVRERSQDGFFKRSRDAVEDLGNTKKYQIWECLGEYHVAGGKAPRDVKSILEKRGYVSIDIHPYREDYGESNNNWSYKRLLEEWKSGYDMILPDSLLFLQYPFCQRQEERNRVLSRLKEEKNISIITLVHDVEQLRKIFLNTFSKGDFEFIMGISDILIVHNNRMAEYFSKIGIRRKQILSLEIFDYLYSGAYQKKQFERSVTIAGNLDKRKSPYIEELGKLKPLKIHLYGPGYETRSGEGTKEDNMIYHGSFPSNQIPQILDRGFGLVWDGDSLDTCSGATGEYLRYNNPHKLSLYLASGLPVIIWKDAAEAAFVERYGVGFTVNSLYEVQGVLDGFDEEQYIQCLKQVQKLSEKLMQGEFTAAAVKKAEEMLKRKAVR